jgi:hypothetical protein
VEVVKLVLTRRNTDHKSSPDGTPGFHTWSTSHRRKILFFRLAYDRGNCQSIDQISQQAGVLSRHILRRLRTQYIQDISLTIISESSRRSRHGHPKLRQGHDPRLIDVVVHSRIANGVLYLVRGCSTTMLNHIFTHYEW